MEEFIREPVIPKGKVYTELAVRVGTFLGGPLMAGYLIAENYKTFGETKNVQKTWLISIFVTLSLLTATYFLSELGNMADRIIPISYILIANFLVKSLQSQKINNHLNAGGQKYAMGRTIGISLVSLCITLSPIIYIVYLTDFGNIVETDHVKENSIKTYGQMKHTISFEKDNITEPEVDRIANTLTNTNFFDEAMQKNIFVKKSEAEYDLYIPTTSGTWNNDDALNVFKTLKNAAQDQFHDKKIVINLCDKTVDSVKKRID